jgi:LPPG:FO 2-phospho-L-lactate transferase
MNVVALSGGVGGARFLRGLVEVADKLTIVGNVGDDVEVLGLHVSPDLDSILYALAGLGDEQRGWGRADETWQAVESVAALGGESWFRLGDRDLGLHLVRTQALRAGPFPFQEWFVARRHEDEVDAVRYEGDARPAPGVVEALEAADAIVIAPSNPYVSIGPILAVAGIRAALERRRAPCIAVSPLIGGKAVKGPADRMLVRLAGGTSPAHVAACYEGLIDTLVIDEADAPAELDVEVVVTRTLMTDADARRRLAEAALGAVPA